MRKPKFCTPLAVMIVVLVLGGASLLSACSFSARVVGGSRPSFGSNGERIYFRAESSSGQPIRYSGGVTMMMQRRNTCANCHGADGKGGRLTIMMMSSLKSPDITWHNLTEAGHEDEQQQEEEEHEGHPPYTEETLKIAITRGINPAGERLDEEMPRWRMSESDLSDLVEFIKTLE